jgi:hypothetical protein
MTDRYATSSEAARALGIGKITLNRAKRAGKATPVHYTPGGHARWDIDDLRRQLGIPERPEQTAKDA